MTIFLSLNCGHLCVTSNDLTERKTSGNESRYMASLRYEFAYETLVRQLERKICHSADIQMTFPWYEF